MLRLLGFDVCCLGWFRLIVCWWVLVVWLCGIALALRFAVISGQEFCLVNCCLKFRVGVTCVVSAAYGCTPWVVGCVTWFGLMLTLCLLA